MNGFLEVIKAISYIGGRILALLITLGVSFLIIYNTQDGIKIGNHIFYPGVLVTLIIVAIVGIIVYGIFGVITQGYSLSDDKDKKSNYKERRKDENWEDYKVRKKKIEEEELTKVFYCTNCGSLVTDEAIKCPKCKSYLASDGATKSKIMNLGEYKKEMEKAKKKK